MKNLLVISFFLLFISFPVMSQPGIGEKDQKSTIIGIHMGGFIPHDPMISGNEIIYFDASGSQSGVIMTGFGNGINLMLHGTHFFSDWGIRLEGGIRILSSRNIDLDHTSGNDSYDNELVIVPVTLGPVYKLPLQSSAMVYFGSSFGFYHSRWTQTHGHTTPGDVYTRTYIKGNDNALGFNMFTGFSFPIYHDLLFHIETGYSVIESIWTLENEDENTYVESKINTGGTSIDIGLQFRF